LDTPCGIKKGSFSYLTKQKKIESFLIPMFSGKIYCIEVLQDASIISVLRKLQELMFQNSQVKSLCKVQKTTNLILGDVLALFLELPNTLQVEILQNRFDLRYVIEVLENNVK
jgi:peptide subunit release factor RF-3